MGLEIHKGKCHIGSLGRHCSKMTTPCSEITGGLLKLNNLFSADYALADSPQLWGGESRAPSLQA